MSQNNQENQTNNTLTAAEFTANWEPEIISYLETEDYETAQDRLVECLSMYSMEPELRTELLFSVACCQYQHAAKFQKDQLKRGKEIAQQVGITQVEAATVKGMVTQWIKSQWEQVKNET